VRVEGTVVARERARDRPEGAEDEIGGRVHGQTPR
jgi:hypothetical protein